MNTEEFLKWKKEQRKQTDWLGKWLWRLFMVATIVGAYVQTHSFWVAVGLAIAFAHAEGFLVIFKKHLESHAVEDDASKKLTKPVNKSTL